RKGSDAAAGSQTGRCRLTSRAASASSASSTTSTPAARSFSAPSPWTNNSGSRQANTTRRIPAARMRSVQLVGRGARGGPPTGAERGQGDLLGVVARIPLVGVALAEPGAVRVDEQRTDRERV